MTDPLEDLFATPAESGTERREGVYVSAGRYRGPDYDGTWRKGGWQRMTNLVGAISDQKALQAWEVRTILVGAGRRPDLAARCAELVAIEDPEKLRDAAAKLAEELKAAGGGTIGSAWGTARHDEWEQWQVERALLVRDAVVRAQRIADELARCGLSTVPGWSERIVRLDRFDAAGKLDNVLWDQVAQVYRIGDLKTQKRFWSRLEIEAQFAGYGHADAVWDPVAGAWTAWPWPVATDVGACMWMPREPEPGEPVISVRRVDMVRGLETLELCHANVIRRAQCKSKRHNGDLSGELWPVREETRTEAYARRLASVDTMADGSALVAEIRAAGLWGPQLRQCAEAAVARLTAGKSLVGTG